MTQSECVAAILAAADRAGVVQRSNRTLHNGTQVIQFRVFEKDGAAFWVQPDGSGRLTHKYQKAGVQFTDVACLDLDGVLERISHCR